MTLENARKKYPGRFLVLEPGVRDKWNKPRTFHVINTYDCEEKAEKAMRYYQLEGFGEGIFVLPNYEAGREMSPELTARMFRALWGMEIGGV